MHRNLIQLRRDGNQKDIEGKWRGSVARCLVDDNTQLEPSIPEYFMQLASQFRAVYVTRPQNLVKKFDLYTELPLAWQHLTNQHIENKFFSCFCFFQVTLQRFCLVRVPRSHAAVCESLERDPDNYLPTIRSILTKQNIIHKPTTVNKQSGKIILTRQWSMKVSPLLIVSFSSMGNLFRTELIK